MLALSLSDKFCCFDIFVLVFNFFVFVFNRFVFFRFSFVLVFIIFSFQLQFSLTNSLFSRFSPFSFSSSLTKITLLCFVVILTISYVYCMWYVIRLKRSNSQDFDDKTDEFKRNGLRSTTGGRLGWSKDVKYVVKLYSLHCQ